MEKSETIKELASALNKAQANLQVAKKGSENPYFHSKYADLLSVWEACREALVCNGLSVSQIAEMAPDGKAVLETILMHTSGEWIKGKLPLLPVKPDPQAQGSAITYARRYSLSAIVGLCTEEDDDAEKAMSREKPEGKPNRHWCYIHQTPFFKKGKMKVYAHPVKDANGEDTGEWCNENAKEKPDETIEQNELTPPSKEEESKTSLIDMDWLKESLEELNWADVSKWIREHYKEALGTTIRALVNSLTREHKQEFVEEVNTRLETYRNS